MTPSYHQKDNDFSWWFRMTLKKEFPLRHLQQMVILVIIQPLKSILEDWQSEKIVFISSSNFLKMFSNLIGKSLPVSSTSKKKKKDIYIQELFWRLSQIIQKVLKTREKL